MKLLLAASLGLTLIGASHAHAAPQSTSLHHQSHKVYCFNINGPLWNSSASSERSKDRLVSVQKRVGGQLLRLMAQLLSNNLSLALKNQWH